MFSEDSPESPPISASAIYEFETFRLDPANKLLTNAGKEVPLSGRAFDVLLLLVLHPGELVSKEDMMASVWSNTFVEDANLTVAISAVRHALGEDSTQRRFITTVPRRGYRFIAEVRQLEALPRAAMASMPEQSSTVEEGEKPPAASGISSPESTLSVGNAEAPGPSPKARKWPVVVIFVGLLAILAAGGWFWLRPTQPIQTLAVLPFTFGDLTTSNSATASIPNEFVLIGLSDAMISRLESEIVVRPASSVLRYSGAGLVDPVLAGREQRVDAVLTGELHSSDGSTTLKLRLIRVRDGFLLWKSSFRVASNDLSQLAQEAGNGVAREIHLLGVLSTHPQTVTVSKSTVIRTNDQAYRLYLMGRYFWNRRTVEGLHKSEVYFRQAINADPNYAPAYAGLADSYALLASFSVEPGSQANADARSAALSAIQLDPTLADPHASLGLIYFFTDWDLTASEKEFEEAIRLNPSYATAHHWYALDLAAMGRSAQALYEIRLARQLDPLSLIIGTNVGWVEYLGGDYPGALRDLHQVLELDPNFVRALTRLGIVEMAMGANTAAVADLTRALSLSGDEDPWVEGLLGNAEARAGNRAGAERILAELRQRSLKQYVPPISRALILLGLSRKAEAVAALAQAVDDHSTSMVYARVDPIFDPLRSDPTFQALLTHIKR
jgi:DNA-binding winged helix-turn-helix (wHTH) protein/tetratricopeptide (TPR) repeat protein/TolB-like protein